VGSFLNVCIYRLPNNQTVITPPISSCCHMHLKLWELVPVISHLAFWGRCRYCKAFIPLRYPLVELMTGLLFYEGVVKVGLSVELVKVLVLTSFLIVIACIDYDYRLILDKVLVWLAGAGVVINLYIGQLTILDMLWAALLGGGILLIVALISRGGLAGGDVKFLAVLGIWLGVKYTLLTLVLSLILGGLGAIVLLVLKIKGRKDYIPFGPYIAVASYFAMLYGNEILCWYWRHLYN